MPRCFFVCLLLAQSQVEAEVALQPTVFADRSYYTTEERAVLCWHGTNAHGARVVDASGKELDANGQSYVEVALRELPTGAHAFTVELPGRSPRPWRI